MENDSKSIIDNINKEYSFKNKFLTKIKTSLWNTIVTIVLIFVLCFFYPGIYNFVKIFLFICKLLNIAITEENLSSIVNIFPYFILITASIITVIILHLLYDLLVKIVMKLKKINE
jgi:hypothetical protein